MIKERLHGECEHEFGPEYGQERECRYELERKRKRKYECITKIKYYIINIVEMLVAWQQNAHTKNIYRPRPLNIYISFYLFI